MCLVLASKRRVPGWIHGRVHGRILELVLSKGTGPEIRPVRPIQRRILLYLELTAHISPTAVENVCMRLWVHLQKCNNQVGWQVADQTPA